jgi:hypothetical protein
MNDDADHVLLTLARGDRGEIRISRSRYEGHTFTRLQLWYPTGDGELRPGRQCVTIRDHELAEVIGALSRVARHVERAGGGMGASANAVTHDRQPAPKPRSGDLTSSDHSSDMEAF